MASGKINLLKSMGLAKSFIGYRKSKKNDSKMKGCPQKLMKINAIQI